MTHQKLLIILLFTLRSELTYSQQELGVNAGFTFNNFHLTDDGNLNMIPPGSKFKSSFGYQTGFHLGLKLTDKFIWCTGIEQRNIATDYHTNVVGLVLIDARFKLNYVQIPICIKYTPLKKKISPYFTLGMATGYLTSFSIYSESTTITPYNIIKETSGSTASGEDWKTISRIELSALGSIGITINSKPGKFFLETKYQYGFTDIGRSEGAMKNRTVYCCIGYLVPINP